MLFRFPIKDVKVDTTTEKKIIKKPTYSTGCIDLNQFEYTLDLEGIARFYAYNGNQIEVMPHVADSQSVIELYLNGSVYGAILHQRKTLPLHGSCFQYEGLGIMICGESGVGKSSLTASFCLSGANFLTDDVTPILFNRGKPQIWGVSDRIKLWSDSLLQLNQKEEGLERIFPRQGKFYFPVESGNQMVLLLSHVFIIQIHDVPKIWAQPLRGVEKFSALRKEIYRSEYLEGMPESERAYLEQIIAISQAVTVTKVFRPASIPIELLRIKLEKLILMVKSDQQLLPTEIM
ncbi:phosphoenolpyruvate carboxykinase (ATP) [Spirosoma endbachense]|uniref:Serine kinase n=1 Tax=Spirosoma endbachense TaxID=2666025 RepID=A0A6P1VV52_9BACT|nr:hypothetical protein [Spirosoma endbachense]QHV96963.1 hypothetical protein GJR95_18985 [Spirosoma endbachense]